MESGKVISNQTSRNLAQAKIDSPLENSKMETSLKPLRDYTAMPTLLQMDGSSKDRDWMMGFQYEDENSDNDLWMKDNDISDHHLPEVDEYNECDAYI